MGIEQEVTDAWLHFKQAGDIESKNWLTVHYLPLVRGVAGRVRASLQGTVDLDDLVSYGTFGLMDAIEKYDLDREVKFETYASARIRGQMFDEIRAIDWVPRNVRSKARDVERARGEVEATLGRPATHAELAAHLGLELADYWRIVDQGQVSVVPLVSEMVTAEFDTFESSWNSAELDRSSNPEDHYEINQVASVLSEAVAGMDERLRTILALYYLQDLTLVEIGEMLGVTGGRVCQLQSRALSELQGTLHGTLVA